MNVSFNTFMRISFAVLLALAFFAPATLLSAAVAPAMPDTGVASPPAQSISIATTSVVQSPSPKPAAVIAAGPPVPVRLLIPSIGLNDPIQGVGVDSTGAMAVPNGKTKNVGWYENGVVPGQVGSAVLDAHVFAAFANLYKVQAGADIYVVMSSGAKLHFVVSSSQTFPLATLTSSQLFVPTSQRDLNLITCAGNLTPDHSTYDHRLIVYATLVN